MRASRGVVIMLCVVVLAAPAHGALKRELPARWSCCRIPAIFHFHRPMTQQLRRCSGPSTCRRSRRGSAWLHPTWAAAGRPRRQAGRRSCGVHDGFSASDARGERYMITAGHCFRVGNHAVHGAGTIVVGGVPASISVSETAHNRGPVGNVDAARIFIPTEPPQGWIRAWTTNHHVWESASAQLVHVQRVRARSQIMHNAMICMSGRTASNARCGQIRTVRDSQHRLIDSF
jgi:hypothetical protein